MLDHRNILLLFQQHHLLYLHNYDHQFYCDYQGRGQGFRGNRSLYARCAPGQTDGHRCRPERGHHRSRHSPNSASSSFSRERWTPETRRTFKRRWIRFGSLAPRRWPRSVTSCRCERCRNIGSRAASRWSVSPTWMTFKIGWSVSYTHLTLPTNREV